MRLGRPDDDKVVFIRAWFAARFARICEADKPRKIGGLRQRAAQRISQDHAQTDRFRHPAIAWRRRAHPGSATQASPACRSPPMRTKLEELCVPPRTSPIATTLPLERVRQGPGIADG